MIYCVGLLFGDDTDKRESRHARRVLETLAEQTGGAAYFPKSVHDVDAIAAEVAQDIGRSTTIAYHSTKSPTLGGYREVHVEAKSKNFGRLSVRTRTGVLSEGCCGCVEGWGRGVQFREEEPIA